MLPTLKGAVITSAAIADDLGLWIALVVSFVSFKINSIQVTWLIKVTGGAR